MVDASRLGLHKVTCDICGAFFYVPDGQRPWSVISNYTLDFFDGELGAPPEGEDHSGFMCCTEACAKRKLAEKAIGSGWFIVPPVLPHERT